MLAGDAQQPQRAASAVVNGGNPFIGARPFWVPPLAAHFFCSRRSDVQELCALIHSSRLVILHGGAGVGKSSLLHAALLPALATTGCQVLELPVTWPDEQRLAWLVQTRQQFAAQDTLLVVDPADALATDTDCLTHCLALLTDAPRLRILFSLRPTPATHLASVLQGAGWNVAVYGLTPPPVAALAPALAASLGHAPGADAVAARFLAALGGAAGDDTVEPVLLQLAGHALWPNLDGAPSALAPRIDAALAAHCQHTIDAALARHPAPVSVRELDAWLTQHLALDGVAPTLVHRGSTASAGLPNQLIDALEDGWLLRTYARGGSGWVGLLDPRLAAPLRQVLAQMSAAMPLAHAAVRWTEGGRNPRLLLAGAQVADALAELTAHPSRYGALEREYLAASAQADAAAGGAPGERNLRPVAILATAIACALLLLTLWALATARTAQREQAAQSAALAAQTDALAERMAQVAQLRAELQTAATEAEAAAAQRQRNEQLGRALRAGQLAGAALLRREEAPTQALLYAVEALHVQQQAGEAPVPEAVQALRDLLTTLGGRPFAVAADDIAALALSADGELIAAGDVAGGLHLWSAHGVAAPHLVAAHTGPVWGLAWLADGRLVSVGADGIAQLWRPQADSAALRLTPAGSTRLSATDLYALDSAAGDLLAIGDAAGVVYLWDATGAAPESIARHESAVNVVRIAPDGSAVASGSIDGEVQLWQASGGTAAAVSRHDGAVNALDFSPDGSRLASAGADGSLHLYDRSAQTVTTLSPPHASAVNSVAFSADGRWLASGDDDGLVRLWSVADPRAPIPLRGHRNSVRDIAFVTTADGPRLLTISYDRTARLWDYLRPESNPVVLRGHDDALTHLVLAGQHFATAAYDRTVRIWQVDDPFAQPAQILDAQQPQGELAVAPDGAFLVASSLTLPAAEVWDSTSGALRYRLEGHNSALAALAVSPDSSLIFTGGRDGRVRIWRGAGAAAGAPGATLAGHVGPVHSLAVHPEGAQLASGGDDTIVRVWEIATGALAQELAGHDAAVMGVAYSPDGAMLASVDRAGVLLLRDAATGAVVHSLRSSAGGFLAVAFRPDGRWVAAAAEDGAIWIWDLAALPLGPTTLRRHATEVNALAFSPAGDLLASVDADGLLYLWDLMRLSAPPVTVRAHPASANAVAFAVDGAALYTAGADGAIQRWTVRLDDLITVACTTAGRNLTIAEWDQIFDTAPYRATCPQLGE
jgi:WD40 repeat protein